MERALADIARVSSRLSALRDKVDHARKMLPCFRDCYRELGRDASYAKFAVYLNDVAKVQTNNGRKWYHGSVADFMSLEVGIEIAMTKAREKIETYFRSEPDYTKSKVYFDRCDAIQRDANDLGPRLLKAWLEP